jgi:hypothetical protein
VTGAVACTQQPGCFRPEVAFEDAGGGLLAFPIPGLLPTTQ